jgi:hypothetical protein
MTDLSFAADDECWNSALGRSVRLLTQSGQESGKEKKTQWYFDMLIFTRSLCPKGKYYGGRLHFTVVVQ